MVSPLTNVQRFFDSFRVAPSNNFQGILYGSFRAMPSKGIFSSSFRAMPFKGIFNSSFWAMPYEGVLNGPVQAMSSNGSVRTTPFESISNCSVGAMLFEGISNISVQAMPYKGICSFHAMPLRGISYSLFQTMPIEANFQYMPFEGITCSSFQTLQFRDICHFSPQVISVNNVQSGYSAFSCCSQSYAYWYLQDFVAQMIEVIMSYLSPVIIFLSEHLQKVIIWYNDFMLHWVTALHKTRNSTQLAELFLRRNLYTQQDFVAVIQKVIRDNLKFHNSIRAFLPRWLYKNKTRTRSL